MAAVSLFWDTNMAAVTSCENTLYNIDHVLPVSSVFRPAENLAPFFFAYKSLACIFLGGFSQEHVTEMRLVCHDVCLYFDKPRDM